MQMPNGLDITSLTQNTVRKRETREYLTVLNN